MINIFYHPVYFKTKKVFVTKHFKYSIFYNLLIDLCYLLNIPMPNNLITAGPQQRFNHLIKSTKNNKNFKLKKNKYPYSYIVQFDEYGQRILDDLLASERKGRKILIGPLYSIENLKKLSKIIQSNDGIKVLTASKPAYKNLVHEMGLEISEEKVSMLPSGVISKDDAMKNINNMGRKKNHCLIYIKKRDPKELSELTHYLKNNQISYDVFEYGHYKNKILEKAAKSSEFGIVLGTTESQGFAIQSLLACNLPLIVIDKKINHYGEYKLTGTTVPYWSNKCGVTVNTIDECKIELLNFIAELKNYSPSEMVIENLTYEVFIKNLITEFKKDF
jgi:hypothetical protein